jgi:serine/threonine-protein kinase RsbW
MIQSMISTDYDAARQAVEEVLAKVRAAGYSEEDCFATRLAVEEALINAIKHGNRHDPLKKISLSADVGERRIAVTIRDEGGGFRPEDVPDPTADENLEKPFGRGIMLMHAYMDQVTFNHRGNEVVMIKLRS